MAEPNEFAQAPNNLSRAVDLLGSLGGRLGDGRKISGVPIGGFLGKARVIGDRRQRLVDLMCYCRRQFAMLPIRLIRDSASWCSRN